jgi:hypothetical protein
MSIIAKYDNRAAGAAGAAIAVDTSDASISMPKKCENNPAQGTVRPGEIRAGLGVRQLKAD